MYDTKIAIVILNDLLSWQKLNVTAFLASAVAIQYPETHGAAFSDALEKTYLPFVRQPMLIYAAENSDVLKNAFHRATERELGIGIYTRPLFATKGETENLAIIAETSTEAHDLVGIVVYGDRKIVDKALKGLQLHP